MYSIIMLLLALYCQNATPDHACMVPDCDHTVVSTMDDDGDPGDSGHVPPKPPVPPPPPPHNP